MASAAPGLKQARVRGAVVLDKEALRDRLGGSD